MGAFRALPLETREYLLEVRFLEFRDRIDDWLRTFIGRADQLGIATLLRHLPELAADPAEPFSILVGLEAARLLPHGIFSLQVPKWLGAVESTFVRSFAVKCFEHTATSVDVTWLSRLVTDENESLSVRQAALSALSTSTSLGSAGMNGLLERLPQDQLTQLAPAIREFLYDSDSNPSVALWGRLLEAQSEPVRLMALEAIGARQEQLSESAWDLVASAALRKPMSSSPLAEVMTEAAIDALGGRVGSDRTLRDIAASDKYSTHSRLRALRQLSEAPGTGTAVGDEALNLLSIAEEPDDVTSAIRIALHSGCTDQGRLEGAIMSWSARHPRRRIQLLETLANSRNETLSLLAYDVEQARAHE